MMPPSEDSTHARGRGRPPHAPTDATRRKVSIGAGGGMRHEDIAAALGICVDTLTKHYAEELHTGAMSRRLEVLEGLHVAATRGSSSAARAYLEHEAMFAPPPQNPEPPVREAKPEKAVALGKKEQANADARVAHVGTEWGDLLKPGAGATPLQ